MGWHCSRIGEEAVTRKRVKRLPNKHAFRVGLNFGDGGDPTRAPDSPAVVLIPTKTVKVPITEKDVLDAIKAKGFLDPLRCAGAVCIRRHAELFSHHIVGIVDYFSTRAYVASKLGPKGPIECYGYKHNGELPRLFDTPAGLHNLLQRVRKGSIELVLTPIKLQPKRVQPKHKGLYTGERKAQSTGMAHRVLIANAMTIGKFVNKETS